VKVVVERVWPGVYEVRLHSPGDSWTQDERLGMVTANGLGGEWTARAWDGEFVGERETKREAIGLLVPKGIEWDRHIEHRGAEG
jgi:hypothetical protein